LMKMVIWIIYCFEVRCRPPMHSKNIKNEQNKSSFYNINLNVFRYF
jgi:hypothetical protein